MNMVSEAVKISDLWITKKRLFRKGNSFLFLFHFCYYISAINSLYLYISKVSNRTLLFFKSFQILSWWYFDNSRNVDPSQLVSRRVDWTSNIINWLKFYPSLHATKIPPSLASIHLFFKPEISFTRLFCEWNLREFCWENDRWKSGWAFLISFSWKV